MPPTRSWRWYIMALLFPPSLDVGEDDDDDDDDADAAGRAGKDTFHRLISGELPAVAKTLPYPVDDADAAEMAVGSTMPDWTMETLYSAALMAVLLVPLSPPCSAFQRICGVSTFMMIDID